MHVAISIMTDVDYFLLSQRTDKHYNSACIRHRVWSTYMWYILFLIPVRSATIHILESYNNYCMHALYYRLSHNTYGFTCELH